MRDVMISIGARFMECGSFDWDIVNTGVVVLIFGLSSFTIAICISLDVVELGFSSIFTLSLVLGEFRSGAGAEVLACCVLVKLEQTGGHLHLACVQSVQWEEMKRSDQL